ncbi:SLC26A/SulP transporter domain [Arabidopsis thaliana x Arabidopsis arenosa]|uniref:SLC26A/SulP transporter domain n=1 Tax=Arabidopsis thaliana x Arabidopsis arenosa TaxID=1240361 RepID=A0A8T1Z4N9_9BRAS|nr:SLC26A/SulP transporter domain [Arabidopsis thaliana x Arabidopsis arenosa]
MSNKRSSQYHQVEIPPPQPFLKSLKNTLNDILFADDPFRRIRNESKTSKKIELGLRHVFPILEWARGYNLEYLKSDVISGITIASLAIPQGISYAQLANLPPILGLYSSLVPPLVYAVMGSSRDLAVGTVAVASLLTAAMLGKEVNAVKNPKLYLHLAFTATFFAGLMQTCLGLLRLGFVVEILSHAAIVGFMGGAATVVCLQQLKGLLGLHHFTHSTDIVSVLRSIFSQSHMWRWESGVLGCCFLIFLLTTKYISKKRPKLFWISAMSPLVSVILGTLFLYFLHAHFHDIQIIGELKKGINPPSITHLVFTSPYVMLALKIGMITGVIALAEGIAVGRSFAMYKNYNIDGNKEMIAFGMMNILGSFSSCYLTTGPFSRSAVNYNAGCKTALSNVVMAVAVAVTLLFLTPLFFYTPLVVLSSIIITAMLGLVDYEAAIHLWRLDKFDFFVCLSAYLGVVFGTIEIGLILSVGISVMRLVLFVGRPKIYVMGNIQNTEIFRNIEHYPQAITLSSLLILHIDGPIYFANSSYLRDRIGRWIDEEEDKLRTSGEISLQYIIIDMSAVGNIDTSGISMLEELNKIMGRRELKLVIANPGAEVMKKLSKSNFIESIGKERIYLTVAEAVAACDFMLHTAKPDSPVPESNNV